MKIVVDSAIPLIEGVLEPYAEVLYCNGMDITPEVVRSAAALVVRTRTKCDESLLEGSSIRAVCSATIGYDHIDMGYCAEHGIETRTAAGCNSRAVLQWFAAAVEYLCRVRAWQPEGRRVGVIGVGCVGSLVAEYSQLWGFDVLCYDPPRAERESGFDSVSLDELLETCDIITLHPLLDASSFHLLNRQRLAKTRSDVVILNSSRGAVIDCEALLCSGRDYILDVWEGEPNVSRELLSGALLSTPHIAGYSLQGKAAATTMSVNHLAEIFDLPLKGWQASLQESCKREISWCEVRREITRYFDIEALSSELKSSPTEFELMRNNYIYRTEFF